MRTPGTRLFRGYHVLRIDLNPLTFPHSMAMELQNISSHKFSWTAVTLGYLCPRWQGYSIFESYYHKCLFHISGDMIDTIAHVAVLAEGCFFQWSTFTEQGAPDILPAHRELLPLVKLPKCQCKCLLEVWLPNFSFTFVLILDLFQLCKDMEWLLLFK